MGTYIKQACFFFSKEVHHLAHIQRKPVNRRVLFQAALVVLLAVAGYLLLYSTDLVGQAASTEGAACEHGKFYLSDAGGTNLELCNCVGNSCAKGSCQGAVCGTTRELIFNPQGGTIRVTDLSTGATQDVTTATTLNPPPKLGARLRLEAIPGAQQVFHRWSSPDINAQDEFVVTKDARYAAEWSVCGNSVEEGVEGCDDGNTITESCAYGLQSCTVCDAICSPVAGVVSFCGDGTVQTANGELCDGSNLNEQSCILQGFAGGGVLACAQNCRSFDTAQCISSVPDFTFEPAKINFLVKDETDGSVYETREIRTTGQGGSADIEFTIKNIGTKEGTVTYTFGIDPENQVNYWPGYSRLSESMVLGPGESKVIKIGSVNFASPGTSTIRFTLTSPDEIAPQTNNEVSKQIDVVQLSPLFTYTVSRSSAGSPYVPVTKDVYTAGGKIYNVPLSDALCGYTPTKQSSSLCSFSIYSNNADQKGDYTFESKTKERSQCTGDKELSLELSKDGSTIYEQKCPVPLGSGPADTDFVCGPFTRSGTSALENMGEVVVYHQILLRGCGVATKPLIEYQCTRNGETGYALLTTLPTATDGTCDRENTQNVGKIYPVRHAGTYPLYRFQCTGEIFGNTYSRYDTGIDFLQLDNPVNKYCTYEGIVGYMQDARGSILNMPESIPLFAYICDDTLQDPRSPYYYRFLTSNTAPDGCARHTQTFPPDGIVGYVLPP